MTMTATDVVSDACQIKDLDHHSPSNRTRYGVSDACQIKDLDHGLADEVDERVVSNACQIKDLDHYPYQATTL